MDYASNGNLNNIIKKSLGMDESSAFKYFIQVASAIYFLHENNIVHRNIQPENILLDEFNNIKLCNFGLAAEISSGDQLTFDVTTENITHEQIDETPYNKDIDMCALGVLLYTLVEGNSPIKVLMI